jgi:uncharacterized protein (TIGR00288 family)
MPVVPMHRGPQAMNANMPSFHTAPNAAMLIDFDNVTMGIRSDLQTELRQLLSSDIVKGKIAIQRAYADWRRYPQYVLPLTESSIDLIWAPAYGSAKKNATDIRLAIDAMELVFTRPEIGTIILLSGDSDFSSLVIKLKEYGKYIIGIGIRESSSDLLVQNCDEYYSYNALAGLVNTREEGSEKHDPWELVTEAVTRMKRNGDVMRSDRLKQVMQEIDSNFDEKELGHPKFSRFCLDAAQRGLLTVTKLENGQLEVDLPRDRAVAVEAPTRRPPQREPVRDAAPARDAADTDGAAGEDRGRPRGRRGRGRGRDRGERPAPREETDIESHPEAGAEAQRAELAPRPDAAPDARPQREGRPPREHRPARDGGARPSAPTAGADTTPGAIGSEIGTSGERLTRDEAFDLVRRAVDSLTRSTEDVVRASDVRVRAHELLGRDSQTLAEHYFGRILRDAHDADVIDLRRRGDDFEVARAAEAAPVSEQLSRAETAAPSTTPAAPAAPRGMGHRGGGPGRGGRGSIGARVGAPPPDLLSIGVVGVAAPVRPPSPAPLAESAPPTPAMDVAPSVSAQAGPAEARPAAKRGARARPTAGRAARKTAGKSASKPAAAPAAAAKAKRPRAKKTASRDGEG